MIITRLIISALDVLLMLLALWTLATSKQRSKASETGILVIISAFAGSVLMMWQ